ncbi:MAG: YedE-related selenium metabolism membrane protein [Deltaproteobacteria bacterium]|nr:YedE-related selenium metabolism membrane protein [Deltaproteobacteria bacterium]
MIRKWFLYPESPGALALLGGLFAAVAVGLTALGNPASSGLCASCFLVNVAGALHLHPRATQSYLRPELLGIVLGAFFAAFSSREFRVRGGGGSSGVLHFVGGAFILLGCEVFIGCPIKALLRTAGGGGAGLVGLLGLAGGVAFATLFLRDGYGFRPKAAVPEAAGLILPGAAFLLLLAVSMGSDLFAAAGFGGGAHHAPFAVSAAAGIFFGAAGQRSRFCVTGSIKSAVLARDFREGAGTVTFLVVALLLNVLLGSFLPSVALEPGAHTDLYWAFLAMAMAGFGAILIAGCPFRQLVLAASGDMDAAAAVAGMLLAASLSVAFNIGSSPAGVTDAGKIAVLAGWVFFLALGIGCRKAA